MAGSVRTPRRFFQFTTAPCSLTVGETEAQAQPLPRKLHGLDMTPVGLPRTVLFSLKKKAFMPHGLLRWKTGYLLRGLLARRQNAAGVGGWRVWLWVTGSSSVTICAILAGFEPRQPASGACALNLLLPGHRIFPT